MKPSSALAFIALLAVLACRVQGQTPSPSPDTPAPVPAATPTPAPKADKPANPLTRLVYTPKNTSAPATRVDPHDGGTRSGGVKLPLLYVLAPRQTGLSARAQPSLFWYQSGPAGTRFELTLVEPKKSKPLLQVASENAGEPGIHRISLARNNVTLAPGIVYRWTVAFVPDRANRSQDLVACGTIQLVEPDAKFDSALAGAEPMAKAALYAGKGYWYDALEVVTNEIDTAPKDKSLHLLRASLLDQAGLKDAASFDRK